MATEGEKARPAMGSAELERRLKQVRALVLDVDGVLTDGRIVYTDRGEEIKTFHVRDGLGIRLTMRAGIHVAVITGRRSDALAHRCRNLGIGDLMDGVRDKKAAMAELGARLSVQPAAMACMGDDLPDIPMLRNAGLSIAVADAEPQVRRLADLVTSARGGEGAVREVCERILRAQGLWQQATADFFR